MAKAFTAIKISQLKPRAKRYEVSDPGCAGLRAVVFPSGNVSFIARWRRTQSLRTYGEYAPR
jgi:hypothetical protein